MRLLRKFRCLVMAVLALLSIKALANTNDGEMMLVFACSTAFFSYELYRYRHVIDE